MIIPLPLDHHPHRLTRYRPAPLATGQRFESSLDLYDYRARFYDPLVGSFISPGRIVSKVGHPKIMRVG